MHNISKRIFSCMLAATLTFSSVPITEYLGLQYEVEAATDPSAFADSYVVDSKVIPDVRLLNALRNIIGNNFTFGQMKNFTGTINLNAYPDIESVEGLGYALKAESIDLSGLSKVTTISKSEFQSCAFKTFKLPSRIVEIGAGAFRYCQNLTTIQFPTTVTKIDEQAFDGCESLDNITLPQGLIKLGNSAFSMCTTLSKIVIPDGINATSESSSDDAENGIGTNVFFGCSGLKQITLGKSMTAIPAGFLQGTTSLTSVEIPQGVISVRDNAFMGSGIYGIDLSKNTKLQKINTNAFSGCSNLSDVKLPESIETIEGNAFSNCESLIDMEFLKKLTNLQAINDYAFSNIGAISVVIPGNVINIGKGAFQKNVLINVEMEDYTKKVTDNTVKVIGAGAFKDCKLLKNVNLPHVYENDIRTSIEIGNNAFENCVMLEEVYFPLNVTSIGDYAFKNCGDSYTDWNRYKTGKTGTTYYVLPENIYNTSGAGREKIKFYTDSISDYYQLSEAYINRADLLKSAPKEDAYRYIKIVEYDNKGSSHIHTQYITGLEKANLTNNNRATLGKGVFYGCLNLKSASLPSNMTEVPDETFYECSTVFISGSGTTYEKIASRELNLEWYNGLETIKMSDNVTKIGDKAFAKCCRLNMNNKLPNKLVYIGANAFESCGMIGDITMPNNVEYIGNSAFKNCSRITDSQLILGYGMNKCDVRGSSKIKYIGNNAFEGCSFDYFLMNSSAPVTMIGTDAFSNCQFMKAISLSDSVEYIKSGALAKCSLLGSIDITDRCTIDPKVCTGLSAAVKTVYNDIYDCTYYIKKNNVHVGANQFAVTIRPLEKRLTVRENMNYVLPVYTAMNNETCSIEEIKVGDFPYTFDNSGMPSSSPADSPLEPKIVVYTHSIEKSDYNSNANLTVKAGSVLGKIVSQNTAVDVQMNLQFMIDADVGYFAVTPSVSYLVDVTANPCTDIIVDSEYYVDCSASNKTEISPKFVATYDDGEITDDVEWTLKTGSEYVKLTPSADGKSATVIATKSNYGNAIVSVKAGSVIKEFNVLVVAPANAIKLDKTKIDMMYGIKESLTATLTYAPQYDNVKNEYPDNVIFTSSDSSIVKVENRAEIDGTTTCELKAVGIGTATITAKAQASGKTVTCVVNVSSDNLKLEVSDADGNKMSNNSEIYLEGKTGKTYTYALSEEIRLNEMTVEIEKEDVVKAEVNTSKNTVTFTGLKKGTSKVSIYPKIGTLKDNGITFNVRVDGDINAISLTKKTVSLNQTDSVFVSMKNVFGQEIKTASQSAYKSITDNEITFESSAPEYVSVDNYGNVTVKKLSDDLKPVTITCTVSRNGEVKKSATTTVTPAKPTVNDISVSGSTTINVGDTSTLQIGVIPSDATYSSAKVSASTGYRNIVSYSWSSKDLTLKVTGKAVGKVQFTITVTNSSRATVTKKIEVTVKKKGSTSTTLKTPSKVKQQKPKAAKKKVTVRWKKVSGASGYQVQMSTKKKSGYKTIKKLTSGSKVKFVKKKLKSKKTYYFRVRAYVKNSSGQVKYGKWSAVKKAKVK